MIVAIDVDGTLIDENDTVNIELVMLGNSLLSAGNQVIIWSGGGANYARLWGERAGINAGADYLAKDPNRWVDIAIDDMPDTSFNARLTLVMGKRR